MRGSGQRRVRAPGAYVFWSICTLSRSAVPGRSPPEDALLVIARVGFRERAVRFDAAATEFFARVHAAERLIAGGY
jgi:hypothetical protein